ncbi:ABC transporter permease [Neobacillus cucumis]|uniref:ABC transporter permease n=1 Tax=Neobacillus cucumis TaxID=1740721 RepID=UPI001965F96B|nr:ABC transporter permease [Neobacillus cucumis]MBM7652571.1 teichoic acid transport system permease protein [Neobacillus cucumis]
MIQITQVIKEQLFNFNLIFRLAFYEVKGQYLMHYLGVFWQFLNPLVQIFVYWFIFGMGIRGGHPVNGIPYFVWLISGLIPWFFINPSITQGSNSVYSKLNLVSKMKFPVSILPSVTIIGNSFQFLVMLLLLIIIVLLNGIHPNIFFIQLVYYMFCLYVFLFSFTLFFSTFSTIVRDFQALLQTTMKMLFFMTPIVWSTDKLPGIYQNLLMLNPIYYLVDGFRKSLLFNTWFYEDWAYTLYFWALTLVILFIGAALHLKFRKNFFDYL